MKRWLPALLCLLFSAPLLAGGVSGVRKTAVGSMLVTGWIEVAPTGKVQHYELDQPSKLPSTVTELINQAVSGWMFEPVLIAGKPVLAKAHMSLRVIAKPVEEGYYQVKITGAEFGAPQGKGQIDTDSPSEKHTVAPAYPSEAAASGVSGTVYVLMMINHQGRVEQDLAQQVDLRVAATDTQMQEFRKILASAATRALKRWTFNIPTTGPKAAAPYWYARVPITFTLNNQRVPGYGHWDVYIPGPVETAPWLIRQLPGIGNDKLIIANVDSTQSGGNFSLTNGLHLISALSGS
ncbi:MAG: energy transducer TonB [Rhodanobacter sp.]